MEKENLFKWKHYQPELILLTVRWYLRYNLSFRNLVEMMEERGLSIAHTTIMRWVHQYGPKLEEKMIPTMKNPIHNVNSDIILGYSTSSGIHCFIPTIIAVGSTIGINSGDTIRKIANSLLMLFVPLLF